MRNEILFISILRDRLYCSIVANISNWLKLYQINGRVSNNDRKDGNSEIANTLILEPFLKVEQENHHSAFLGMAMAICQYFIVCTLIRRLLKIISIDSGANISLLHLMLLIEACHKNRH